MITKNNGAEETHMNNIIRRLCFGLGILALFCSISGTTAEAATRLTPAHLYNWAKTGNITRLQQFKRYINLQDRNRNTALCLAQQAEDRDAYALLLKFGASTKVPCHDDNDPICAVIAGEKLKYLRPAFCCSVPEQPPGHIFCLMTMTAETTPFARSTIRAHRPAGRAETDLLPIRTVNPLTT